jgi:hypothetical protein
MILLDENIVEDQCERLRGWRIRFHQIGYDIGRKGMKDEEQIIPLLHKLKNSTFVTRDLGFFREENRHARYCLVCLAVSQKETADFLKRFLRHPCFDTKTKRMGKVAHVSHVGVRFWRMGALDEQLVSWAD